MPPVTPRSITTSRDVATSNLYVHPGTSLLYSAPR